LKNKGIEFEVLKTQGNETHMLLRYKKIQTIILVEDRPFTIVHNMLSNHRQLSQPRS